MPKFRATERSALRLMLEDWPKKIAKWPRTRERPWPVVMPVNLAICSDSKWPPYVDVAAPAERRR